MLRRTLLPALALAALALSGCGASGDSSAAPASSAPAASAPASSAAAPSSAASTPEAFPSATSAAAEVKDPCKVLSASDVSKTTGVKVKKGTTSTVATSKLCSWLPEDGTTSDAAVFTAQEGPLPGPLSQVEGQLKTQFNGKVTTIKVAGADDARYVTGKKDKLNVIDVLAKKDDVFFQVLVASPRDADQHKDATIELAEALLKG
ncbi:DUF3558 family protein [Microlunatus antarcticus]|uniref:DUF3558 domain-containing protein n=1 Tax=Microlunatus antarcticus TaxID=53388 RepID=A0A7W5JUQ3_9ACTN|nr:DUF3558 family protein [Microlunatus antarcticus]MBB3326670.1 hypothetical protein [Microlunatus antarcticus]